MNAPCPSNQVRITPGPNSWYRKLPVIGPLLDELLGWLRGQGFAESTLCTYLIGISCLFRWLRKRRRSAPEALTESDLQAAYDWFRTRRPGVAGAARALERFLRVRQLIPVNDPVPLPSSELELQTHGGYLRQVRGMAESTIQGHQNRLRFFLRFLRFDQRPAAIRTLEADQVDAFLRNRAKTNNRFSLQHIVASVRGFLQRQHAQGVIKQPLHQQIDTPRTYRLEQLPRAMPWNQVIALLRSIDRSEPNSMRDFTILYLAARYGLRSGELVRLTLDDIDWRVGALKVPQTKTKQILCLPLTNEAGDVLTQYLETARPHSSFRELFLRRKAPLGPLKHTAVHDILEHQIRQSGLNLPRIGTHSLRHSLAVHLLQRGVPLGSIGDVLGHRDPESTTVYLRLAVDDLREVALPVPRARTPVTIELAGWEARLPRVGRIRTPLAGTDFGSKLAEPIRQYLATRRALGRKYSVEEAVLRGWDDFLQREFPSTCRVHSEMFHRWAQSMPHLHPTVRRNRLRIVRNFLLFHRRQHPKTFIPDIATFPQPSPHRPPRLVTTAEMGRVLSATRQLPASHQNPLRPETVELALILLFCCGLRRGELLRLQWQHCDLRENVLHIESTKFHKSRLVPLSPSVARVLQQYQQLRRRRGLAIEPNDYLIWSDNPLASSQVYSAPGLTSNWQSLCLLTGVVDERGRPPRLHDLRHSCAVAVLERWYKAGTNLQVKLPHLATYLGHVSPVSTHHYLHLTPALRQAANQRFHEYVSEIFADGGER